MAARLGFGKRQRKFSFGNSSSSGTEEGKRGDRGKWVVVLKTELQNAALNTCFHPLPLRKFIKYSFKNIFEMIEVQIGMENHRYRKSEPASKQRTPAGTKCLLNWRPETQSRRRSFWAVTVSIHRKEKWALEWQQQSKRIERRDMLYLPSSVFCLADMHN